MKNLKRFNEGWFSKGSDDDIAERIIEYIEDAKSNAQTLTLNIEYEGGDCNKYIFYMKTQRVKVKEDIGFLQLIPTYSVYIDDEKIDISNNLSIKIYKELKKIHDKVKIQNSNSKKNEIRRKIN